VFLTGKPLDLLQEGRFHKVPFISGITSHEGMLIMRGKHKGTVTLKYSFKLPQWYHRMHSRKAVIVNDSAEISGSDKPVTDMPCE
jgi:hypothetical protein